MATLLSRNLRHLRTKAGQTQAQLGASVGIGAKTIANWETEVSSPDLTKTLLLSKYFGVSVEDLATRDLEKEEEKGGHASVSGDEETTSASKKAETAPERQDNTPVPGVPRKRLSPPPAPPSNIEPFFIASDDLKAIPIVDISVAAGDGYLNPDHMDVQGYLSVPKNLIQRGFHLAVRSKGESMEPTIPDSTLLIIRLLDSNEWQDIRDEEIYVVTDRQGTSWVKTVKNRLEKYGFLVLMSENPDKAAYPNFNVENAAIHNVWHVDAALQFRFRHVYNQYMDRLRNLEDAVEEMQAYLKIPARNSNLKLR